VVLVFIHTCVMWCSFVHCCDMFSVCVCVCVCVCGYVHVDLHVYFSVFLATSKQICSVIYHKEECEICKNGTQVLMEISQNSR